MFRKKSTALYERDQHDNWFQMQSQNNYYSSESRSKVLVYNKNTSAVVCPLLLKPVNLKNGRLSVNLQSSDLYFLSIHAILHELDHQYVHLTFML